MYTLNKTQLINNWLERVAVAEESSSLDVVNLYEKFECPEVKKWVEQLKTDETLKRHRNSLQVEHILLLEQEIKYNQDIRKLRGWAQARLVTGIDSGDETRAKNITFPLGVSSNKPFHQTRSEGMLHLGAIDYLVLLKKH